MNFLEFLLALAKQEVDFVVVGGVASKLYGSRRLTFDVDIVVDLEQASWERAVDVIWQRGGRPRIPEPLERIRDIQNIHNWIAEKDMRALTFRSPDGAAEVDVLVSEADDFQGLKQRATKIPVDGQLFRVASIADLIRMKTKAGRPQDLQDIEFLQALQRRSASD